MVVINYVSILSTNYTLNLETWTQPGDKAELIPVETPGDIPLNTISEMIRLPKRRKKEAAGMEGNHTLTPNNTGKSTAKRAKTEKRPLNKIRYDTVNHWPDIDGNENATRCKNENCMRKTHFFCSKCNVHLCLIQDRNCFKNFHVLNLESD